MPDGYNTTAPLLKKTFLTVAMLDASGFLLLSGMVFVGGYDGKTGLAPYWREVCRHLITPQQILLYACALVVGSFFLEFFLREIVQRKFAQQSRRDLRGLGVVIVALLYGATHAVFNYTGVVYATLLGTITAVAYQRVNNWRILAIWHAQWNLLAVGGTLFLLFFPSLPPRSQLLYQYKYNEIKKGNLRYRPDWGWIDKQHYDYKTLRKINTWLEIPGKRRYPLRVVVVRKNIWGQDCKTTNIFGLKNPQQKLSRHERQKISGGILLAIHRKNESAQEVAPFGNGDFLSAWQFDDLPSAMCVILDEATGKPPVAFFDTTKAQQLWRQEGLALVSQKITTAFANEKQAALCQAMVAEITRFRAFWYRLPSKRIEDAGSRSRPRPK